jgi:O-antigen ligase
VKRLPEFLLVLYSLTGTISIAASQAVMSVGGVVALLDQGKRTCFRWRWVGLEAPFLAWALSCAVATVFASDPSASAGKLKKLLLLAMIYWAPGVVERRWSLGRLFMGLLFSAGVTSLYGVLTFFLQGGPALGHPIRGFHGFYMTNSGLLLLCTFPALLFAAARSLRLSYRIGAALAAISILLAQFFGCLPGAWLGSAAGFCHLALRRGKPWLIFGPAALAALLAWFPGVFQETTRDLLDPGSPGNRGRIAIWTNGLELFALDPISGFGLHDLRDDYARVSSAGEPLEGHMHSVWVQILASMGLPGMVAFLWLCRAIFRELASARSKTESDEFACAVVDGAEAGFVAFLAAGLVEWNLGDSEILALLFFLVGTALAAGRLSGSRDPASAAPERA